MGVPKWMMRLRRQGVREGIPQIAWRHSMSSVVKSLYLNLVRNGVKSRTLMNLPLIGEECMESFFKTHFEQESRR